MARLLWLLILFSAACNFVASPSPTSSPTDPPTQTPTVTALPTETPPLTPTITPTEAATSTITPTLTVTPTFTPLPPPTTTPRPVVNFTYDSWERFDGSGILNQLASGMVAFVNFNNRETVSGTPQPVNDTQTLYFVNPLTPGAPISVAVTTGATGDQIYIAPTGDTVAYLRPVGAEQAGVFRPSGLYVIDMQIGIDGRVLPITSLIQQNIFSPPVWSPDGTRFAIALDSGYDLDIYSVGRDGANPTNLTQSGAYEFYPAWSPDGRYLAFVSDRNTCPSWRPGEPETCDGTGAPQPYGGNVFVLDTATGSVIQVGTQYVTEPPVFVNARTLAYAVGDPILGDQGRAIWMGDIITGTESPLQPIGRADDRIKLGETFAGAGGLVFYQAASDTSTEFVVLSVDGREIARSAAFTFSRYGTAADFSPDGSRIAIGGRDGQCPYGALVLSNTLNVITAANPPPSMCEPQYSPDGRFIAYTGINPRVDGRVDVYVANSSGGYIGNLTSGLRGQILLLGWAGQ